MKIRTKTAALIAAIVLTTLASTTAVWIHLQETSLRRILLEGIEAQARMASHGLAAFVEHGLRDARVLALALPADDLAAGRLEAVDAQLARLVPAFPRFQNGVFLLDPDGRLLTDFPRHPALRGASASFREYFQRTRAEDRGVVGVPYRSLRTGRPVLTFTAPVRDARGRTVAVLACSTDLLAEDALGRYRRQRFGETGQLHVVNGARQLVLHPDDDKVLARVDAGMDRLLDAALAGGEGGGTTVDSEGATLLATSRVPSTDWVVAVQVAQAEAFAPVARARLGLGLVAGAAMALALAVTALAVRRVTRPVQQLERIASHVAAELEEAPRHGTREVAAGAIHTLGAMRSDDEIGRLASAFLRLAQELKRTLDSLQRAADRWERTFDSVHDAVLILGLDNQVDRMNRVAEAWFRMDAARAAGQPVEAVLPGAAAPPDGWARPADLEDGRRLRWSAELDAPRGCFELSLAPIARGAAASGAVLVVSDVTERVESERRIRGLAFFDHLTGLPNRLLLEDRIRHAIAAAEREGRKAGVLFIDLDRFKAVNDTHGHEVGDAALREITRRLSECVRKSDTLARFGGDEFVAVLHPIDGRADAEAFSERIARAIRSPVSVAGRDVSVGSSIGIAVFPDDGEDGEALLRAADREMYLAKARGARRASLAQAG